MERLPALRSPRRASAHPLSVTSLDDQHRRRRTAMIVCAAGLLMLSAAGAPAVPLHTRFSLDPASPSIDGNITPDDVLAKGPGVYIQGRDLGLQDAFFTGIYDNLADFSFGKDPIQNPLYFSVDRVAIGVPGTAVFAQALPGIESAAGDVYRALPPDASNLLFINERNLGLVPGFFGDDIDGLELDTDPTPYTYFAIDRLSVTSGFGASSLASDILVSPGDGNFGIYATFAQIGLDPSDAIDGLVLLDVANDAVANPGADQALFSVDPFSPDTFTFTGLDYVPCVPGHMSPADVCYTDFTGAFSLWTAAPGIGLRPDDNVDALDTIPGPVPEPATSALLGVALSIVVFARTAAARRRTA